MGLAEKIKDWVRNKADQPIDIKDVMAKATIDDLYTLCRDRPDLAHALTTEELATYWHQLREHFCPIDRDMSFQFKSQSYVPDANLILGTIFFHLSLDESEMRATYMEKALGYNSFHAFYATIFKACTALQADSDYEDSRGTLVDFLVKKENVFLRHQEPGLLLISYAYFSLALAAVKHKDADTLIIALREALKYAHAAKRLSDFSEADCFNAYFSKDLALSNPFHLENTPAIIEKLDTFASQFINTKERMTLIDVAKEYVKELKISEPAGFIRPFARRAARPTSGSGGGEAFFKTESTPGTTPNPGHDADCDLYQKM